MLKTLCKYRSFVQSGSTGMAQLETNAPFSLVRVKDFIFHLTVNITVENCLFRVAGN